MRAEFCEYCGSGPTCGICGRGLSRRGPRVLSLLGDVVLFVLGAGVGFGAYLMGTALRVSP